MKQGGPTTSSEIPLRYNAADLLFQHEQERGDAIALVCDQGTFTFHEVCRNARRVASGLAARGVRSNDVVAIIARDGPEWVYSFFATLHLGAIAAGVNTLLTEPELAFILRDGAARVVIGDHDLIESLRSSRDEGALPQVEHWITIGGAEGPDRFEQLIEHPERNAPPWASHREGFCTLNYSSGTTGEPKGILHTHQDLLLSAELYGSRTLGLNSRDRTFGAPKLFFTFGLGGNLLFPWHVGASVVLFSGAPRVAKDMIDQIEKHRPTVLYHAPTGYAALLAQESLLSNADLTSLRICVSAGEALPAPVFERWREATGLLILDGIGSTENFHIFASNRPNDVRAGTSGKAVEGYELRIVDEAGIDVDDGEVGNLWVRGETAAQFYLNRADATRETFLGPWLATGDKYVRDSDGYLTHAGRTDDMLKVGGIWVSPVEVESALMQFDRVQECAVIGREDEAGLTKPHAYVVLVPDARDLPEAEITTQLIDHCRSVMAAYKRPRTIDLVTELPKTATGKIQRYRLRNRPSRGGEK